MNPFVEIVLDNKMCVECGDNFNDDNMGVFLQCECSIHSKCIKILCEKKFGDEMNICSIDKRKLFDILEQNNTFVDSDNSRIYNRTDNDSYQIMCFGTYETDGIIKCPKCNLEYSVLSSIYRDFGIPKLIQLIVLFINNEHNKLLSYHMCTNIDSIHLLSYPKQKNILKTFKYVEENLWDELLNEKSNYEIANISSSHYYYHAVIVDENNFVIFKDVKCPACDSNLDNISTYKHATIDDYMTYLKKTKEYIKENIYETTDDEINNMTDTE